MSEDIQIGSAVLPRLDKSHDVMTVYDFAQGFAVALCNWVIGTRMHKGSFRASELIRVIRLSDIRRNQR